MTTSSSHNSIHVIFPYKLRGIWMFDDADANLRQEPFVSGAPEMIEHLVASIPGAEDGFALYFSEAPFPQYQAELVWLREEYGGNWYRMEGTSLEGWLCPALFAYFSTPPPRIYCKTEPARMATSEK